MRFVYGTDDSGQCRPACVYVVILTGLLIAFVLVELALLDRRSLMIDDAIHIPAGYSYLKTRDFRLNAEHPPFIKVLSAVGLEHVQPELPLDSEGWAKAEEPGDPDDGTNTFCIDFFKRNADKFEQINFWGRLPIIFVPVVLAIVAWVFTRELFGDLAAILAVFFLLSEPTIIGNSNFVQDDVASALAVLLYVVCIRAYLLRPSFLRYILLGLALGFALLVKHSLGVLVPITIAVLIANTVWRRFKYKEPLCRHIVLSLVVLGCSYLVFIGGYAFDVSYVGDDEAVLFSEWLYIPENSADSFQEFIVHLPLLLPKYYLWGMDLIVNDFRNGRIAFLLGDVSDRGWWYYFPVAYVLKTTVPFLLVTLSGILYTLWTTIRRRWLDGLYLLLPPLGYLGMSMASHLNIGVRHIMPVFPFFAIIGAGAVTAFLRVGKMRRWYASPVLAGTLVFWIVFIVITTFPNYTTYFSPLAGGSANGWKLLSDSNVETGQDVKDLAAFLKDRGETRTEGLFVGSGFLPYYGVENCELPCGNQEDSDADDADMPEETGETSDRPRIPDEPANFMVLGAYYLEEIDLKPEQNAIIDHYRSTPPEYVINNAIFVFRKKPD